MISNKFTIQGELGERLKDKVAVATGAGRGIGRHIAPGAIGAGAVLPVSSAPRGTGVPGGRIA